MEVESGGNNSFNDLGTRSETNDGAVEGPGSATLPRKVKGVVGQILWKRLLLERWKESIGGDIRTARTRCAHGAPQGVRSSGDCTKKTENLFVGLDLE